MASSTKSLVLFLALNLLFSLISACATCGTGGSTPSGGGGSYTPGSGSPSTGGGGGGGSSGGKCPRDALKLGVCANALNLLKLKVGSPPTGDQCCALIPGVLDLEAAVCLCTNIKLALLGINLNIPVDLSLLVNYCGKQLPRGFQCF